MPVTKLIAVALALMVFGMPVAAVAQDSRPGHEGSPLIQILFVHKEPGQGRIAAESSYLPPGDEGPFFFEKRAILADPQIRDVQVGRGPDGEMTLVLSFTPEGVAMLKEATASRVGSLLGLMLDSHLVAVTTIVTPFSGQLDHLTVPLSPDLPNAFRTVVTNKIRARWRNQGH